MGMTVREGRREGGEKKRRVGRDQKPTCLGGHIGDGERK